MESDIERALTELKTEILKSKEPLWWKFTEILLPVAVAAALGFFINIKIDEQEKVLEMKLSLTEEFFKARYKAYFEIHNETLHLRNQVLETRLSNDKTSLINSWTEFHNLFDSYSFYLTDDLRQDLDSLWFTIGIVARKDIDLTIIIENYVHSIKKKMRKDLLIDEISNVNIDKI